MRITSIGHAGLYIESAAGSLVCDPWFTPAYFGSWVPFPDNSVLDPEPIGAADYLYVSHLHRDHFDPDWLGRYMNKDATVLLPDYSVPDLRESLEHLGFHSFVQTHNDTPITLESGLRVLVNALVSPTDGPLGDSGLAVDDGQVRIYNQNDSRPVESGSIEQFGPLHGHFLQYSGAIWYPMVYDFPERMKHTVGSRKRRNGMARALKYIEQYQAAHVFPFAGPPCFLDDEVWEFNDFDRDEANVFPDQFVFLDYLAEQGFDKAHLFLPGTTVELTADGGAEVAQIPEAEVIRIRDDRRGYLTEYKQKVQPRIDAILAALPQDRSDLVGQLQDWVQPLMETADYTCSGLNGRILLEVEAVDGGPDEQIVFDFLDRKIKSFAEEEVRYSFRVKRPLIEQLVRDREPDWVNVLFLSCRFQASRKGGFNEYVYSFFKSLSVEHMTFVEGYYAETTGVEDYALADGHVVQRHCPHLKADLTRFGSITGGVLTCALHGWEFDIDNGRCLTSDDRRLVTRPASSDGADDQYPRIASNDHPEG